MTSRDQVLFRTLMDRSLTGRIRLHGDTWYLIDCDKPKLPMLVSRDRIEGVVPLRLPLEDSRGTRRNALDIVAEPAMLPAT